MNHDQNPDRDMIDATVHRDIIGKQLLFSKGEIRI